MSIVTSAVRLDFIGNNILENVRYVSYNRTENDNSESEIHKMD